MFLLMLQIALASDSCPLKDNANANIQQIKANELSTVLTQAKGCQTLIEIWASWCGPCVSLAPYMSLFHKEHPEVLMLSVSVDNSYGAMAQFVKTHQVPGQIFHLNPWTMSELKAAFEPLDLTFPERIPYVVLLDSKGVAIQTLTEPSDLRELKVRSNTGQLIDP